MLALAGAREMAGAWELFHLLREAGHLARETAETLKPEDEQR